MASLISLVSWQRQLEGLAQPELSSGTGTAYMRSLWHSSFGIVRCLIRLLRAPRDRKLKLPVS